MREVVFVAGARSAFCNMGGGLAHLSSTEIAGFVMRGLLERTQIQERGKVDGVVCGNALRDMRCNNPARYATLCAGLPVENGVITRAVDRITVAGSFMDLLKDVTDVGNDLTFSIPGVSRYGAPSLLVRQLTVAGS